MAIDKNDKPGKFNIARLISVFWWRLIFKHVPLFTLKKFRFCGFHENNTSNRW